MVPEQPRDAVPAAPAETPAFHQQGQAQQHSQLPGEGEQGFLAKQEGPLGEGAHGWSWGQQT